MTTRYSKSLAHFIRGRHAQNEEDREWIRRALGLAAVEIGKNFPSVSKLHLFGSAAGGPFQKKSDVDIIAEGVGTHDFLRLHSFLEKVVKRSVDLVRKEDIKDEDMDFLFSKSEVIYEVKKARR